MTFGPSLFDLCPYREPTNDGFLKVKQVFLGEERRDTSSDQRHSGEKDADLTLPEQVIDHPAGGVIGYGTRGIWASGRWLFLPDGLATPSQRVDTEGHEPCTSISRRRSGSSRFRCSEVPSR